MGVTGPEPLSLPENPWFSPEELRRFAECLTGDSDHDQHCFRALLATVSEVLGGTDLDELLRRLVDHTVQTTGTERGILLLRDNGRLEVRIGRDRKGTDLGKAPVLSRSVPETVLKENRPLLARVSSEGEVLDLTHSVASMRLRQVMCAPVRARGRTLGVIYVDSTFSGPAFTPADLTLFYAQAGLMGMAIENNRLFRETIQAREMSHQLRTAREIQKRLLPETPLKLGNTELAGLSEASNRVGGDYFDYFPIDLHRVGLSVGDVSGHGIGPALIMSNVRAHLRSLLLTRKKLSGLYGFMNRALCEDLTNGMFVALFVAIYDTQTRLLEFQNAGQVPPLIYSPGEDRFFEISTNVPALGVIDDISAGPCPSTTMRPGDYLLCITDGVTEAPNAAGDLYGDERVRALLRDLAREGADPTHIVATLREDIRHFTDDLPMRDDVTIVAAKF